MIFNQSKNSLETLWEKSGDAIQYITPPKTFQEKYEGIFEKPCGQNQSNTGISGKTP